MQNWLIQNVVGIAGIVIGGVIALLVFFLSRRLGLTDKLSHRTNVQKTMEPLTDWIQKTGQARTVELINTKKYLKYYPQSNVETKDGYTYLKTELKGYRFDGVEFFCEMPKSVYEKADGEYSLSKQDPNQAQAFVVYPVGLIPYEWIRYVEPRGDDTAWRPQFFTDFKGSRKSPYKSIEYYVESDTYYGSSDPFVMKYRRVDISG
jgi:hypothetical protein